MANPAGVTAGVIFTTAHASAAFASMSIVCGVSEIPRYRSSTPVLHPRHLVFSTPPFLRPCPAAAAVVLPHCYCCNNDDGVRRRIVEQEEEEREHERRIRLLYVYAAWLWYRAL